MVLCLQSASLHEHVGSEEVAPGGALQILVCSDTEHLEHLIVLSVFHEENKEQ